MAKRVFWYTVGVVLGFVTIAAVLPSCATGPNPCIGSASDRETMPCTCPATLNPGCEPWLTDVKKYDASVSNSPSQN